MKLHFSPPGHTGTGFTVEAAHIRSVPNSPTLIYDKLNRLIGKIATNTTFIIEYDNDEENLPPMAVQHVQPIQPAPLIIQDCVAEAPTEPLPSVPETAESASAPVSHRKPKDTPQRKIPDPQLVKVLEHATEEIDMRGEIGVAPPGWMSHFPGGQHGSFRVVLPRSVKPLSHLQRPDQTLLQRIGAQMDNVPSRPNAMLSS